MQFDEADLAGIVLNSVPVSWMNQYNMMHTTLLDRTRTLLQDLVLIECIVEEKHKAGQKAKAKEAAASTIAKGSSKKCSASGNPGERVPNKRKPNKFCQHCKAKGGPHLTHNTKECRRYSGMGNSVAVATCKSGDGKSTSKKEGEKLMAYLTATIESLMKKGLKKAMKSKKRKRNRTYDSPSSSDSNSKQEAGCCDTEHIVDKHLKLDKPFLSYSKSTQPRPIKVMGQIPISDNRADEKSS